ncbi:MAG TPA: hypothetical protein VJZ27_05730, partial [Aggregatilineales bacterium]|nr:hypothetical protein [Aggregatilineales bacterium]
MQKTNSSEILVLFDVEQRQNAQFTDSRAERSEKVCRQIGIYAPLSFVLWAELNPDSLDALVQGEMDYFDHLEHDLEWKIYEHDPHVEALKRVLSAHGFEADE